MQSTIKPQDGQRKEDSIPKKDTRPKDDNDVASNEDVLAPDADTDTPLDGGVVNDATLRGEDHENDNIDNLADKMKNAALNKPGKKEAEEQ
jgi:hypothetical protein